MSELTGAAMSTPGDGGGDHDAAEELVDPRLVGLLDPAAELLRGAFPYSDASRVLADEQPVPSLRVRRRVDAPGLRLVVDRYRDDERIDRDALDVIRLPLDRVAARPRQRAHPAPSSRLRVTFAEMAGADRPDALGSARDGSEAADRRTVEDLEGGDRRLTLPGTGPGPQDVHAVLAEARRHRIVLIEGPYPGDPVLLAALVLQVAAAGTACSCAPELLTTMELLSPELRSSLLVDLQAVIDDDLVLAGLTATQKRAAWAGHDLRLAWGPDRRDAWVPHLAVVPWPSVSVVVTSRRPEVVPVALAMIAAQRDVELEVVVALHGGGDVAAIERALRRHGLEGRVTSVPASVPFGAAFNHAIGLTRAPVVLKWDDDDLYGPWHVQDLLVARRQTGAAMVGKTAEFVYFDGAGQTIWRTAARAESASIGQAGGTFLLDRAALDEIGGFPDVSRAIDHHLKVRLRDAGTTPFRTHGFGFVLRRHAHGHTWDATDERFRTQALRTLDGLPEVLQLGHAARYHDLQVR